MPKAPTPAELAVILLRETQGAAREPARRFVELCTEDEVDALAKLYRSIERGTGQPVPIGDVIRKLLDEIEVNQRARAEASAAESSGPAGIKRETASGAEAGKRQPA